MAIAVMALALTPPVRPAAPIMISMITAPEAPDIRTPTTLAPTESVAKKPLAPIQQTPLVSERTATESAPAASPPSVSTATTPTETIPSAVAIPPRFDAAYLENPAPTYPPMARRMGEQGRVTLRVLVNTDGTADKVELRTSSGSTRLDQSALDTVQRWRFIPAKLGAQSVAAWVLVPISFTLGG